MQKILKQMKFLKIAKNIILEKDKKCSTFSKNSKYLKLLTE